MVYLYSYIFTKHISFSHLTNNSTKVGVPGLSDYCASKFAAVGFDESIRFVSMWALSFVRQHLKNFVNFISGMLMYTNQQIWTAQTWKKWCSYYLRLPVFHRYRHVWGCQDKVCTFLCSFLGYAFCLYLFSAALLFSSRSSLFL